MEIAIVNSDHDQRRAAKLIPVRPRDLLELDPALLQEGLGPLDLVDGRHTLLRFLVRACASCTAGSTSCTPRAPDAAACSSSCCSSVPRTRCRRGSPYRAAWRSSSCCVPLRIGSVCLSSSSAARPPVLRFLSSCSACLLCATRDGVGGVPASSRPGVPGRPGRSYRGRCRSLHLVSCTATRDHDRCSSSAPARRTWSCPAITATRARARVAGLGEGRSALRRASRSGWCPP